MSAPYPQPLFDRVLVQRLAPATMSEEGDGLLEIPEMAQQLTGRATVVRTGPDCSGTVKEGDEVVVSEYAGVEITFDKKEYLIVREKEVILRIVKQDCDA